MYTSRLNFKSFKKYILTIIACFVVEENFSNVMTFNFYAAVGEYMSHIFALMFAGINVSILIQISKK